MHIGIIGVTGLVGQKLLEILEERQFPVEKLTLTASSRSVGKKISWKGKEYTLQTVEALTAEKPSIVFLAAGSAVSRQWAPVLADLGCYVIDKSSTWRLDPQVPLVIPEINSELINHSSKLIATPNCSTSQLVLPLQAVDTEFGLHKVIVSTYQAVSGTGTVGIDQYKSESTGQAPQKAAYPHPIHDNCLPHCGSFDDQGYTEEEMKLVHETRKILKKPDLQVSATAVRVPVLVGHGESVSVECDRPIDLERLVRAVASTPGVKVLDNPAQNVYPTPQNVRSQDPVGVGRIRLDLWNDHAAHFWVMGDNLRKGAALNAIQIAEAIVARGLS